VFAALSWRDLVPEIWLLDPSIQRERELARFRFWRWAWQRCR